METDIGDFLAQGAKAFPRIFAQETHGGVEGGAAPHFQAEKLRGAARHGIGHKKHVVGTHACREEGLVGVAEGGVGEEGALLLARPLGEFFGSELEQLLPGAGRRVDAQVDAGKRRGGQAGGRTIPLGLGISVDRNIGEELHQLGGAVTAQLEFKECRSFVDESGGGVARAEDGVGHHVLEERHVGLHAANAELAQGAVHAVEGDGEGLAGRGDLDQQRVVERRDRAACRAHARVEAHAEAGGTAVGDDLPVIWGESIGRVLRGDAALHGEAVAWNGLLRGQGEFGAVQAGARRDEDLRAYEVDTGDLLGHGVLDLDARIHLDEKPLVTIVVVEEFHRARVVVAYATGDFDRRRAKVGPDPVRQIDRRGHLDHLLVTTLHRAVAFVQVKNAAVRIAENLHFDVLGPGDVFFEKDGRIAESAAGLVAGLVEKRREIAFLAHHAHAAAAAAESRFDDQREADFFRDFDGLRAVVDRFLRAGKDRNAELDRQGAGGGFVAHHFEQFRPRTDEGDASFPAGTGKVGVLGKKSVARMDHVHTAITG